MAEAWEELYKHVSSHIGYSLPNSVHTRFQTYFDALVNNASEQLNSIKERNLITPIYDGLCACHYHKDNIQKLEDEIVLLAKKHIPYSTPNFNGAIGGGNTGKITIEYQSFILAEKHLLEYVTKCITTFLNISEVRDFSELQNIRRGRNVKMAPKKVEEIRKKLDIYSEITHVLDKFTSQLDEIYYNENGETPRNKISHRAPLAHNQIGITIGPKGAIGIYYTGLGDLPKNTNNIDPLKYIFLIQQEKGYVGMPEPLVPLLIKRLETLHAFVFNMLDAIFLSAQNNL